MRYFLSLLCVILHLECIKRQNFGQMNLWMLISYIILFIIDLFKDNHVRASVNFLFKKTSPQKLLTGFLPDFTGMFLR